MLCSGVSHRLIRGVQSLKLPFLLRFFCKVNSFNHSSSDCVDFFVVQNLEEENPFFLVVH